MYYRLIKMCINNKHFSKKTDICNIITGYMYMSFKEGNFNISFFSLLQFKGWQKCNKMANNCKIEEHL